MNFVAISPAIKSKWYIFLILFVYLIYVSKTGGDFDMFMSTCDNMLIKESIYLDAGVRNLYYYTPVATFFLIPFSILPSFLAGFIWKGLNIFFLIYGYLQFAKHIDIAQLTTKQRNIFLTLMIISVIHFCNLNLRAGQMTIFMLLATFLCYHFSTLHKPILAGFILALALVIKLMPVILIPYLVYRGYFKTIFFTILFSFFLFLLPIPFLGFEYYFSQIFEWKQKLFPSDAPFVLHEFGDIAETFHAIIVAYLADYTPSDLPNRNFMNLDIHVLNQIAYLSIAFFGLLMFAFLDKKIFKPQADKLIAFRQLAYLFVCVPLIFPMQQKYSYLYMALGYFYLYFFVFKSNLDSNSLKRKSIIVFIVLSFILSSLSTIDLIVGFKITHISEWYKLTPMGGVCLVIALLLAHPKFISAKKLEIPV